MDVVFPDKGHHVAVGAPDGTFLWPAVGQRSQGFVPYIIYIIYGSLRTTVDSLGFSLNEDVLLIGAHDVSIDAVHLYLAARRGHVEQNAGLFAIPEGIGYNLLVVGTQL